MHTRRITKADFDHIVEVVDRWWGGPIHASVHPMFFYELGNHALIVEEDGVMIGFLLGFVADAPRYPGADRQETIKTGYVHLVGIHPEYRRRGVGRLLYAKFVEECIQAGCARMKAITITGNEGSIRFHLAVGWHATEDADYAGRDRKRIVFTKELSS